MTLSFAFAHPSAIVAPVWQAANKGDSRLIALADKHYTRRKPGSIQCCRPGHNFVLALSDGTAAWVVWRPIPQLGRMDGLEAWECTFFRNEGACLSSDLVREATELTYRAWGWPPRDGLITCVGISETARRRSKSHPPGWCFIAAGWRPLRERGGKAWLLAPRPVCHREARL
jgi:hypothetical protein